MLMHPLSPFLGAEQRQDYSVSWIIFANVTDDTWKYVSRNVCTAWGCSNNAGREKKRKILVGGGA